LFETAIHPPAKNNNNAETTRKKRSVIPCPTLPTTFPPRYG
jgi:hypothetical protein